MKNYESGLSNLVELEIRKCIVLHGIDVTKMASHTLLAGIKFDRIVFNFPYAGFFKELPRDTQLGLVALSPPLSLTTRLVGKITFLFVEFHL